MDTQGFLASLSDWILGTGFGILSGSVDSDGRALTFFLTKQDLDALTRQDRQDIQDAPCLTCSACISPPVKRLKMFSIMYWAEGESPRRDAGSAGNPGRHRHPAA